jgi:transporter family protein
MNEWLVFTILALLAWGLWGFFPKLTTGYLDPKSALVFEIVGAMAIGLIVLALLGFRPQFNTAGATFGILTGLAGATGALFFLFALSRGELSITVTATALYPLVTVVLAFLILKEPITLKQGIGMVLALAAMALLAS